MGKRNSSNNCFFQGARAVGVQARDYTLVIMPSAESELVKNVIDCKLVQMSIQPLLPKPICPRCKILHLSLLTSEANICCSTSPAC